MTSNPTSPRNSESSREGDFDPNMVARVISPIENQEEQSEIQDESINNLNQENDQQTPIKNIDESEKDKASENINLPIIKHEQPQLNQLRYKVLMQILNAFGNKFTGSESVSIDEWLHQLEFLVKPHNLSSAEKAYLLVNSVRGRAFMVLTEGDSSNYEELKNLLLNEFRQPGAYMKSIQDLCNARQGKHQKVAGYYHYLSKKMS